MTIYTRIGLGPGLFQFRQGAVQQRRYGQSSARPENSSALPKDQLRPGAPLNHQVTEDQVNAVIRQRNLFGISV